MDGSVLERKSSFKVLGLIISVAKSASKKIGALIHSMKFISHVPSWYLELLDKLQKQICKTVGPSLAVSLEPLAHRQNVARSLFYRYYFGRCSSELAELVPLPYS